MEDENDDPFAYLELESMEVGWVPLEVMVVDSVVVAAVGTDAAAALLLHNRTEKDHVVVDSNNFEVDTPHDHDEEPHHHHWQFVLHEGTMQYLDSNPRTHHHHLEDHASVVGVVDILHSNDWEVVAAFADSTAAAAAVAAAAPHYDSDDPVSEHDEYYHYPQPLTPMTKSIHNYSLEYDNFLLHWEMTNA
jgi:hypothetical protein